MKKQHIIIISLVVVVALIAGGIFLFKGKNSKQNNNFNPQAQNQNTEEVAISSLVAGNWVSVVAEKSADFYTASMIMVCDSKDSCQKGGSSQGDAQTPPSGTAPTGNTKAGGNTVNKTMLSGTITEVGTDSIILTLDTGETATVSISDSTKIVKR